MILIPYTYCIDTCYVVVIALPGIESAFSKILCNLKSIRVIRISFVVILNFILTIILYRIGSFAVGLLKCNAF